MTCCVEDITFMGLACTGYSPEKLENGGWYTVTANVNIQYSTVYGKRGPVLAVSACIPAEEPEQEVATFY
jgi:putative outer membrane insertion C-signal